jgi:hypothetical protein
MDKPKVDKLVRSNKAVASNDTKNPQERQVVLQNNILRIRVQGAPNNGKANN